MTFAPDDFAGRPCVAGLNQMGHAGRGIGCRVCSTPSCRHAGNLRVGGVAVQAARRRERIDWFLAWYEADDCQRAWQQEVDAARKTLDRAGATPSQPGAA